MLFNKSCFSRTKRDLGSSPHQWRVLPTRSVWLRAAIVEDGKASVGSVRLSVRTPTETPMRHSCGCDDFGVAVLPLSLCDDLDLHAPRHTPCVALQAAAVFDCSAPQPPFFLSTRDVLQCSQSVVYYYVLRTSSIPLLF